MYNEPQKLLYIESYLKSSNVKDKETRLGSMCNFFNRIQEPEVSLDKDFSMFNYEEIKMALAIICRRSVRYQKSVLSELRGYLEWSIDNGLSLDCENRLIGITPSDIDIVASYRINMFGNETELNLALDKILTPMQEDTSNNILRAILHLLFNGVSYNAVFDIRSSEVDFENNIIHLHGRDIKISVMCCNILRYVMGMYEFFEAPRFDTGNIDSQLAGLNRSARKFSIVKSGYAIENSRDNRSAMPLTYKPIITKAFAALKAMNRDMISTTIGDIVTSGIFYRIFENEKENGEPDFSEYFIVAKQDDKNEYGLAASLRDAEAQYYGWKKAFGLVD